MHVNAVCIGRVRILAESRSCKDLGFTQCMYTCTGVVTRRVYVRGRDPPDLARVAECGVIQ
jgi:hypothetical protein